MLFARELKTNNLIGATKGIKCVCPTCGELMVPKCGAFVTHHFAHVNNTVGCGERYHDGMSEWHYMWQREITNPRPGVNIEVPTTTDGIIYKRADLKPQHGVIIEFQRSSMPLEERQYREKVYRKMIWVVHKDIENNKIWKTEVSETVPIFIDHGDHLKSISLVGECISREEFVKIYINSNNIKYYELQPGYWKGLRSSFNYYDRIPDVLKEEERQIQKLKVDKWKRKRREWREKLKSKLRNEKFDKRERKRQDVIKEKERIEFQKYIEEQEELRRREYEEEQNRLQKEWMNKRLVVSRIEVSRHGKYNSPDSVEIIFRLEEAYTGPFTLEYSYVDEVRHYLALESKNDYARSLAINFIRRLGGKATTVDEALNESDSWDRPKTIVVKIDGKYLRIIKVVTERDIREEQKKLIEKKIIEENKQKAILEYRERKGQSNKFDGF